MPVKKILQSLQNYQNARQSKRGAYLEKFEERMIYRTTKTENPETTPKMVKDVLGKFKQA